MIKYRFYSTTVTKELPPGSNSGREFLVIGWSNDFCLSHDVQHFSTPTAAPSI